MTPWLQYLIAFVVGCHGLTYIPFGLCVPDNLTEWRRSSWLLGSSITGDRLKALVLTVHVMAGIATLACAVAIGFAPGWWRLLAIIGGAAGIGAFVVFWDGQARLLAEEGGIGAFLSLILIVSGIAFA